MKPISIDPDGSPSSTANAGLVRYIPELLTPLAFTSVYGDLSAAQQSRYNQLVGLHFLEQTIFFEQCMGRPAMEKVARIAPIALREIARQFIEEEDRHTSWFRELLRECEPQWYVEDGFQVLNASPLSRFALSFCAPRPEWFPCLLWLQILAEERAQYFGALFISHAGGLDERFVAVQRRHLADEGGHIRWDIELIEWLWPAIPLLLRHGNARLLNWLLREFFRLPKRSGWNAVERLLQEFSELRVRRAEFRSAMASLAKNDAYLKTLYPRSAFPRTRRLAARWPELHGLEQLFTD